LHQELITSICFLPIFSGVFLFFPLFVIEYIGIITLIYMSDTNNTEPLELSSPEPLELLGEPQHLLALQAGTEVVSEAVSEAPLISIQ
jgi:hypothetical protein